MPPQRTRYIVDDARSEASNNRENATGFAGANAAWKNRRHGNTGSGSSALREVTSAAQTPGTHHETQDNALKIDWSAFDSSVVHAYRHAHRLHTPTAFTKSYNQRMLSMSGIGQISPTMARHRDQRRISKEQLAAAVRKDFNAAIINEQEIVTSILYIIGNQDKHFRMRFDAMSG
ncbi:MAG: hypothetical protein Q9217_006453, partial [Psora testacea]